MHSIRALSQEPCSACLEGAVMGISSCGGESLSEIMLDFAQWAGPQHASGSWTKCFSCEMLKILVFLPSVCHHVLLFAVLV